MEPPVITKFYNLYYSGLTNDWRFEPIGVSVGNDWRLLALNVPEPEMIFFRDCYARPANTIYSAREQLKHYVPDRDWETSSKNEQ